MSIPVRAALDEVVCDAVRHELRAIHEHILGVPDPTFEDTLLFYEHRTTRLTTARLVTICADAAISPADLVDRVMQRAKAPLDRLLAYLHGGAAPATGRGDNTVQPAERSDTAWLTEADQRAVNQALPRALGTALRTARLHCGISRKDLAARMPSGIHPNSISSYENGASGVLVTRLVDMCYTLRLPPGDVIEATLRAIHHTLTHPTDESPKRPKFTWTDEQAAQVAAMYLKGWSLRRLAQKTGRSYGTIRNMILSTGTPLRSWGNR